MDIWRLETLSTILLSVLSWEVTIDFLNITVMIQVIIEEVIII